MPEASTPSPNIKSRSKSLGSIKSATEMRFFIFLSEADQGTNVECKQEDKSNRKMIEDESGDDHFCFAGFVLHVESKWYCCAACLRNLCMRFGRNGHDYIQMTDASINANVLQMHDRIHSKS